VGRTPGCSIRIHLMRVLLSFVDDELEYFIDEPWVCNCKDCVKIEPQGLTPESSDGRFERAGGATHRQATAAGDGGAAEGFNGRLEI